MKLGLQGMINKQIEEADFSTLKGNNIELLDKLSTDRPELLANLITSAELGGDGQTVQLVEEARKNLRILQY